MAPRRPHRSARRSAERPRGTGCATGWRPAQPSSSQVGAGNRWTVPRGPKVLTSERSSHSARRTSARVTSSTRIAAETRPPTGPGRARRASPRRPPTPSGCRPQRAAPVRGGGQPSRVVACCQETVVIGPPSRNGRRAARPPRPARAGRPPRSRRRGCRPRRPGRHGAAGAQGDQKRGLSATPPSGLDAATLQPGAQPSDDVLGGHLNEYVSVDLLLHRADLGRHPGGHILTGSGHSLNRWPVERVSRSRSTRRVRQSSRRGRRPRGTSGVPSSRAVGSTCAPRLHGAVAVVDAQPFAVAGGDQRSG